MADKPEEKKTERKTIFTSYVGTFKADTLKIEDGVASVALAAAGASKDIPVKAYKDHVKDLEAAVKAGGEVIVRGALLGGRNGTHLAFHGVGPEEITGRVSNVKSNLDTYEKNGKVPFVDLFMLREIGEHKIGTAVRAFGDDALALKGIAAGDVLTAPARQTRRGYEVDDAETGEKKTLWAEYMRIEGTPKFEPSKTPVADEDPEPAL
ncbi:hypothetical protein LAZ40_09330 [Cereibacter sphaeroides]|uniref:hypothetical protein n=1 Tax=Cereibacter sphaeroides TaxID=1063 RepID=UPI001F39AE0B|nr:hypothetical protein [Cereibacter sphaeroides]MCE6959253.1 hypothetical protein [Cereibacter sphaeroides]MCE6971247.1 hypothetical protein [Cereibacter sphaeroides]